MIRFIWRNWWRNKERFILLLVGALIVSSGLTYLVGLSEINKTTIIDELQKRWSASYDIVVRPQGSRSITEEDNLLEPNYLSGLNGGISLEQYEKIKSMTDIEVAAPIAMIGYADYPTQLTEIGLEEPGIYRVTREDINHNGVNELSRLSSSYHLNGDWDILRENFIMMDKPINYLLHELSSLRVMRSMLIAGIDPEQEAKLVGLDKSIVDVGVGRYFTSDDISQKYYLDEDEEYAEITFPVILSNFAFTDKTTKFTIERLPIPFSREIATETLNSLDEKGRRDYLESLKGRIVRSFTFSDEDSFTNLINSISAINVKTGKPFLENHVNLNEHEVRGETYLLHRPSPLKYRSLTSPFPERWAFAYEIMTFKDEEPGYSRTDFRQTSMFDILKTKIKPRWIGFYDPSELKISRDITNELPMETYRPASAELVINSKGEPVNPPAILKPVDNPFTFLTSSPTMLTTIQAAADILGDEPISAIRIKVAGVSDLSEESQQILEQVVQNIENETGLLADITLGSSPQPTLTHVPEITNQEELGWFQQPWVKIGSSMTIFKEAKIGFSGLVFSVMAVAIIYVWASGLVSLLARRKEFAVLLAIGWRPNQLGRLLYLESTILGIFVAFVAWIMLGSVYVSGEVALSPIRFLLTGIFGFLIYLLGAVIPAFSVRNISPYETMRTGEITKSSRRIIRTRGLFSMAFNHFIGKWKRSILSIFAISLPTGLLALFLFTTIRLKGIMYTTWLGQYVALEVGPVHYFAMIVALIIAILTTAEIMWQNIAERQQEIAFLKAVGWKNSAIRLLILMEGLFSGLFAALVGLSLAFAMMRGLYGVVATEEVLFILSTGLVPIIIALIGSILPAERAVRISPSQGMVGNYSNRIVVERTMKWVMIGGMLVLFGGFVYTMIRIIITI